MTGAPQPTTGRDRCRDEEGTVLVLALAFMVVFATVVYALLDLGATGYQVMSGADERLDRVHAAEGAIELALTVLIDDPAPDEGACPTFTVTVAGHDASVGCEIVQGPEVRVADLTASVGGVPQVRARVRLDDDQAPPRTEILNWTVLR